MNRLRRALRWIGRAVLVTLSVAVFIAAYIAMVSCLPPTP